MRQFLLPLLEILEVVIVAAVSIYLVYAFIAQPFKVDGKSMEPNFSTGDYLIIDEITYRFRNPVRGEVVVLHNPTNDSEFFIKRIIGLPGEEVVISDNKVLINGERLGEEYLSNGVKMSDTPPFQLGGDEYFVMGDNRASSFDSRNWGPLGRHQIVGVVRIRFWPPGDLEAYKPAIENA
ncbi:MAG: signal peptidase I [bacterium]|nr:signal peptidase I [bacterium]